METGTLNNRICFRWEKPNIPAARFFDQSVLIDRVKKRKNWVDGELVSIILLNRPEKQVLLTGIHEGTEISSFQSKNSITIQTLEGKLRFFVKNKSVTIDTGQLLTFTEKVNYKLKCMEKTVFLLTINCNHIIPVNQYGVSKIY